jgi:23S rRNA pseudouridine955/2504/2580 synthase/23S rRNA pseudouridine1911/1915/1917 synthase
VNAKADLDVLWSDDDYVAVFKPPGLATIPGRGETDSVLERLAAQLGLPRSGIQDPRLRVVHRLDKETSGVLVFAKNIDAQRHLSHQFQNNQVEKEYLALVYGRPAEASGEIDAPIARHPSNPLRMAVAKHAGRPARTVWNLEEAFRGYSLLRVFPKTGKTHQIRVHLKHIGMPLAVDALYNAVPPSKQIGLFLSSFKRNYRAPSGEEERPLISRLTLHAHRLKFHDPADAIVQIEAPLPKDFRAALNMLRKYGK